VSQRRVDRLFCAARSLLVPKDARKLVRSRAFAWIWRPALLLEAHLQLRTCLKGSRCEVFRLIPSSFCLVPCAFLVVLTGPNLESVGVFHLGDTDQTCPTRSLECELERRCPDIKKSLIVLPEAFNVADGYYAGTGPTPSIRKKLVHFSERYGVAFVAGLVEDKPASGNQKGFNSAYLIDASAESAIQLISQKRNNAQPDCAVPNPDGTRKIVRHRGFGITALICNDFMEDCYAGEIRALLGNEDWEYCEMRVLCIPSWSTHRERLITVSQQYTQEICVAASNGYPSDMSFVRGKGFQEILLPVDPQRGYQYNRLLSSKPEVCVG